MDSSANSRMYDPSGSSEASLVIRQRVYFLPDEEYSSQISTRHVEVTPSGPQSRPGIRMSFSSCPVSSTAAPTAAFGAVAPIQSCSRPDELLLMNGPISRGAECWHSLEVFGGLQIRRVSLASMTYRMVRGCCKRGSAPIMLPPPERGLLKPHQFRQRDMMKGRSNTDATPPGRPLDEVPTTRSSREPLFRQPGQGSHRN
jgi:hypothetical protein